MSHNRASPIKGQMQLLDLIALVRIDWALQSNRFMRDLTSKLLSYLKLRSWEVKFRIETSKLQVETKKKIKSSLRYLFKVLFIFQI